MNENATAALSDRFKLSFKLALALAIVMAYGFAHWKPLSA
jgi:hypothetical protein